MIDAILPLLPRADIVLLSDYAKGVLTARVIRNVIDAARKLGKRVIVDPKSANLAIYRGATLIKPNRKEFAEATRSRADTEKSIATRAQDVMQLADCEAMLVTQSEHGMTLVPRNGEAIHVPGLPVKVRDVSGAGDTVAAVLAVTLAGGRRLGDRAADGERGGRGRGQQEGCRGRSRRRNCAARSCRTRFSRRKRKSSRQRTNSTRSSWSGASRACGSASPMAASTSCIPATSRC